MQQPGSSFGRVGKVVGEVTSVPVPVPVVSEVESAVQLFLALEPVAQKLIIDIIHHFHKQQQSAAPLPVPQI